MAHRTILPPQRTELERAIDEALPQWDALVAQLEPAAVRENGSFQPWLAMQWQVAQFAQYFASTDALLTAALPWLFERGNAASVRRALSWLGYDQAVVIEEDDALLHIDLGRLVQEWELAAVAHVVRASIPLHVGFWRVYHGWDLRPIRLDGGPGLDTALLDNDSGVLVDVTPYGQPVKLSQGAHTRAASDGPAVVDVQCMQQLHITTVVTYDDRIVLDAWRLDSELLVDASLGATLVVSSLSTAPMRGVPQVVPRAEALIAECPWLAPAPITLQHTTTAGDAPRPNDDSRTWQGCWDDTPWRPYFETNNYEET